MRPTILFLIPTLGGGGAEKVILWLADCYAKSGADSHIVTMSDSSSDVYQLPKDVTRHSLDLHSGSKTKFQALTKNIMRLNKLRAIVKVTGANVVISFTTSISVLAILACKGNDVISIVAERSNPVQMKINFFWRILRKITFRFADTAVAQTQSVASWLKSTTKAQNVTVINNPVIYPIPMLSNQKLIPKDYVPLESRVILSVGRLTELKGFLGLIEAFGLSCGGDESWHLVIIGEGPERNNLQSKVNSLHLNGRVHLPGRCDNIGDWYERAEIFILSSFYEGFPNVLIEAMSYGVAVISTDCDYGPSEIIENEVSGLLVPVRDATAMTEAISRLTDDQGLASRLGKAAISVRDLYSSESTFKKWSSCIDGILKLHKEKIAGRKSCVD